MQFINVTAFGRLTRDPVLRGVEKNVCSAAIAVNRSFKRQGSDEYTETTTFLNIVAFNGLADRLARLKKGHHVALVGMLESTPKWINAAGDEMPEGVQLRCSEVESQALYVKPAPTDAPEVEPAQEPVPADAIMEPIRDTELAAIAVADAAEGATA